MPEWLDAWKAGRTGVPYVDAAMRMLAHTGWLNMRLRGTVVSFALNELWLPWREVGLPLTRKFLAYDGPSIGANCRSTPAQLQAVNPLAMTRVSRRGIMIHKGLLCGNGCLN